MTICPNKSSKEWKELTSELGEDKSLLAFLRNNSVIPTISQAKELISDKAILQSYTEIAPLSQEKVINELKKNSLIVENVISKDEEGNEYYARNPNSDSEILDRITDHYGPVLSYNNDFIGTNKQSIDRWNNLATSLGTENKTLDEVNRSFLSNIGVSIQLQNDLSRKYGVNGVADFSNMMITIQEGREQALTEESLHFFIDMLPQDTPELITALDKVRNTDTYKKEVGRYSKLDEYKNIDGSINYFKIKKEILAKELTNTLENKFNKGNKQKNFITRLYDKIISWIKSLKLSKDPSDIIAELYLKQDITRLNRNLRSSDVFFQLTEEEQEIYNNQEMNESQQQVRDSILANTSKFGFDEKEHQHYIINPQTGDKEYIKSVTQSLGSDFYTELESPDIISELLNNFSIEFPDIDPFQERSVQAKQIIDKLINEILKGEKTREELTDILRDEPKIVDLLFKASENQRKTLFGTSIHNIVRDIILDKPLDLSNIDEKIIDRETLNKVLYGSIKEEGLLSLIKNLKNEGKVLMSEIQIGNNELAGIIDLLTIDKDGVVDIYDFKTKYLRPGFSTNKLSLEEEFKAVTSKFSNIGVKEDTNVLPELIGVKRSTIQRYSQQLSLYKKLLLENNIKVRDINVIGIPYRLNKENKIDKITSFVYKNVGYNSRIGNTLFNIQDSELDQSNKKTYTIPIDSRIDSLEKISKDNLKLSFVKTLERLNELYHNYKETKSGKALYDLLKENEDSNSLARIKSLTENTLNNFDNVVEFLTVQKNFLEMIDSSSDIIDKVSKEFERLRATTPTDQESSSQRLNELGKVHNFLTGYQRMFDEINKSLGVVEKDNPLVEQIKKLMGHIEQVQSLYVETILPDIKNTLGSVFTDSLVNNLKREMQELIQAAKQRKDSKLVEQLTSDLDNLTSDKYLEELMRGQHGDVGWFFGKCVAQIGNPDLILAGVAKKLKATLDGVRLTNKDLRDRTSIEFDKRRNILGKPLNIKTFNESLVYWAKKLDPVTGKEREELTLKSEFDESLYYEESKLLYSIEKSKNLEDSPEKEEAIKKANKDLRDFQVKYLQTNRTPEYYKLVNPLNKEVEFNGVNTTIDNIRKEYLSKINTIQRQYHEDELSEGKITDYHIEELEQHWDNYYELFNTKNPDGSSKKGDKLLIAETLNDWSDVSNKIYDDVEIKGMFDKREQLIKFKFGENSEEYKKWKANNTRLVVTKDYYDYISKLYEELSTLNNNPRLQEVQEKYEELRALTKPYKDKDGNIDGTRIPETKLKRISEIDKEIEDLNELAKQYELNVSGFTPEETKILNQQNYYKLNEKHLYDKYKVAEIYYKRDERMEDDPTLKVNLERRKEIIAELSSIRKTEITKYYYEKLEEEERNFAESRGVSYEEFKASKELYSEFKDSKWYQENHSQTQRSTFDSDSGTSLQVSSYTPIYIWKRSTPINVPGHPEFIQEKPTRAYYKRILKESYINDKGETIPLVRKDNRDILGRLKPKEAQEYLNEHKERHPYLNEAFNSIRDKYLNNTANLKERLDYENLIFLHKEMLEGQDGIEMRGRLGLAVPFMSKTGLERTIESGGQNIKDSMHSAVEGIKRKFVRTEDDIDHGLPSNNDYSRLATVDNDEMRFIPVQFTSKGEKENASYDVWGGALNYIASINRKKELEKEVAFINGLDKILGDKLNQPKSESKNLLINSITKKYLPGIESKINKGGNVRLDILRSFVNSVMYNEEYFEGYDILGVNTQKIISEMMSITSFTALGFAPFNWGVNFISGNVQNMVETVGGNLINIKDYNKSKKLIYSDSITGGKYGSIMKDMTDDFGRLGHKSFWGQMMEVWDPIQGEAEKEYANGTKFHGVKNILHLGVYSGKVWGEWEIQTSTWLAFMMNHKLVDGKIMDRETFITKKIGDISNMSLKEISNKKLEAIKEFSTIETNLLDIFELDSNRKLVVKDQYKDSFEVGSKEFSDIVAKLHAMQKKLNGSYAKFDKTYVEKTSLGRMMFFFRRFFIPLGMNRWGDRRIDYEGMNIEEGFYRTFIRTMGKDLLKMRFNVLKNWGNYSDLEKRNIKKTLTDVAVIMTCLLITSMVMGYDPDDPERMQKLKEEPWAYQALIFLLLRTKSETEQFIPTPSTGLSEINRVYTNPSIIFSNITQYINLLSLVGMQVGNTLPFLNFDKELYYQHNSDIGDGALFLKDEGDSKLFAALMRSFAGYTGKTFSPVDAIKSFEFTQRLR